MFYHKTIGCLWNIATAYPDYEMQESLFEIKIIPSSEEAIEVTLSL
jgi:HlyD family secretion protein